MTPAVEVVRAPVTGKDYGPWGAFYHAWFGRLISRLGARLEPGETLVFNYEAPILPRPKFDAARNRMVGSTTIETVRKLNFLGPLLETMIFLYQEERAATGRPVNILVGECNLISLKKELAGHGGASKDDMIFVARRAGIVLPEGDEAADGADGFAAWLLAVRHHAPEHQRLWDSRIYGSGLWRR